MRLVTLNFGAVLTLTQAAAQTIPTPDDQYPRRIKRIFITPATALVQVQLIRTGFTVATIDATRFAAGNWPVEIDEWWPATLPIQVAINNQSAGTVTPQVVITYDAPDNPNDGSRRPPA